MLFCPWTPNRMDLETQSTSSLAVCILGSMLESTSGGVVTRGIIVEAEAYLGIDDHACHTYGGRKTPRLEVLWRGAGCAYVYAIHRQWLLNITTQPEGVPQCVLIRALWPVEGLDEMAARRGVAVPQDTWGVREMKRLTSGPGKLCRAMGIDRAHNGLDVLDVSSPLRILPAPPEALHAAGISAGSAICAGPRIGVESSGEAAHSPLRFWFAGNKLVSKG